MRNILGGENKEKSLPCGDIQLTFQCYWKWVIDRIQIVTKLVLTSVLKWVSLGKIIYNAASEFKQRHTFASQGKFILWVIRISKLVLLQFAPSVNISKEKR